MFIQLELTFSGAILTAEEMSHYEVNFKLKSHLSDQQWQAIAAEKSKIYVPALYAVLFYVCIFLLGNLAGTIFIPGVLTLAK